MLPYQASVAQVIIAKLEPPHRFDLSLHCKCGFQSHGYFNTDKSIGDEYELARQAARTHLINRHGATPKETEDRFRIAKFTTVGGMVYDQLDLAIQQHREKAPLVNVPTLSESEIAEAVKEDKANPTQEEQERAALKNNKAAPVAKPVQAGGVTK